MCSHRWRLRGKGGGGHEHCEGRGDTGYITSKDDFGSAVMLLVMLPTWSCCPQKHGIGARGGGGEHAGCLSVIGRGQGRH